jgi:hypothetical protein
VAIRFLSRALGWRRSGRGGGRDGQSRPFAVARERLQRLHDPAVAYTRSDEEILEAVDGFCATLRTNYVAAAEALFAAVAPLCDERPRLIRPLMRRALLPLVYLGYERSAEVERFVARSLPNEPADIPHGDAGRAWLANELPWVLHIIQELLDELGKAADAAGDERSYHRSRRASDRPHP